MKRFFALALMAVSLAAAPAFAQIRAKAPKAPVDLSGIWIGMGRGEAPAQYRNTPWPKDPPFTAAGVERSKHWGDPKNNLGAQCLPTGGPYGAMNASSFFPVEVIQKDAQVTIIAEYLSLVRRVFMDGRAHPEDIERTWLGHSTGKWEGATLVIDTVKVHYGVLNGSGATVLRGEDETEARIPFSQTAHFVERLRLLEGGKYLESEVTITDPTLYTKPLVTKRYWRNATGELDMLEYVCNENRRPEDEGYAHLAEPKN